MTHPSGPAGTHPPNAGRALSTFECSIGALLIVFASYAVKAINPDLFWPTVVITVFGVGTYILARIAATRGIS